jgi:hypothetical protein
MDAPSWLVGQSKSVQANSSCKVGAPKAAHVSFFGKNESRGHSAMRNASRLNPQELPLGYFAPG